jgi:DNA polymerase III subunit delta'
MVEEKYDLAYFKEKFPFVIKSLQNVKKNGRLSHSYIVYSDNPSIRRSFVFILAQIILCTEGNINIVPCGICDSCRKIEKGIYPDLYTLEPVSKSRQIVIGKDIDDIDTIRWFQSRFSLSSMSETGGKIGIIRDADRITVQAQNAFLKNLEEPPKRTSFILTSGNPHTLLPTVISRCQFIPLLTNKCSYDFADNIKLYNLLFEMISQREKSLSFAVSAGSRLIKMFENLRKEAEISVNEKWKERLANLEDLESNTARKRITIRYDAAIAAEYRLLREYFLSAVYSWFAQVFQTTCEVDPSFLANPEIISNYLESDVKLTQSKSGWFLNKTEKFISNLKWNIDEKLAVQEFCLNLIVKQ